MFSYCYHLYISLIYVKEAIQGKFIGKVRVIDIVHINRIQKKKRKSEWRRFRVYRLIYIKKQKFCFSFLILT